MAHDTDSTPLDFCHLIFIGVSICGHVSLHESPNTRLNHGRPMSLTRPMVHQFARVLIVIGWTRVHLINAPHFAHEIEGSSMRLVACEKEKEHSPTQRKRKEIKGYIR